MFFERFYDDKLAQASYLVGCEASGEALVVDPNRDAEQYVRVAKAHGMRVTHVTETHIHADFVSGSRELAQRTGAVPHLSDEGGDDWRYGWARDAETVLLKDGSRFMVGNVRVDVMHTPGHTPEHLCFVITDTVGADGPMGVLTGDFIFVGDVGRPDLLERAAGVRGTMVAAARALYRSLERFRMLPDYLQLWPGHGAGSACGKALSADTRGRLGEQRRTNYALADMTCEEFVTAVLDGLGAPPAYFAHTARRNREARPVLLENAPVPSLSRAALTEAGAAGALVASAIHDGALR